MAVNMLSFLLLSVTVAVVIGKCPDQWIQFKEDCLWFSTRTHKWEDAESDCHNKNSYLASDDSNDKHNFLLRYINIFDSWKMPHWWVGGSDLVFENSWRWVETGRNVAGYSAWDTGEPDGNSSANCMSIGFNANHNLIWRDDRCSRTYNYICEQAATGPSGTMPVVVG